MPLNILFIFTLIAGFVVGSATTYIAFSRVPACIEPAISGPAPLSKEELEKRYPTKGWPTMKPDF